MRTRSLLFCYEKKKSLICHPSSLTDVLKGTLVPRSEPGNPGVSKLCIRYAFISHVALIVLYFPGWLNYISGTILFTDGIVKEASFSVPDLDLPQAEYDNFHSGVNHPVYTL
jgi:hypothetical protein